jgi:hypothetical protein
MKAVLQLPRADRVETSLSLRILVAQQLSTVLSEAWLGLRMLAFWALWEHASYSEAKSEGALQDGKAT